MLKNYLTVAFRNLWRSRLFSLINVAGLAIGISAALVIYLIVHYEFSFDRFHTNGERKYRIVSNMHFPDQDLKSSGIAGPLPAAVRSEIPGIQKSTFFWVEGADVSVPTISGENKTFRNQGHIIFADNNYFSFFKYQWLAGSPENALNAPGKVVLTESRAKAYFPFTDMKQVPGKTITYRDTVQATVTGVVKDLDEITDFTFKEFISWPTFSEGIKKDNSYSEWGSVSSAAQFFVQLSPGISAATVNKQLLALRKRHFSKADYLVTDNILQPLHDIHFNAAFDNFDQRQAHKPTLYGLLLVAAFLLILGCINFINLTTARASQRAKEIGIRKTLGSSKKQLVTQIFTEMILLTIIATIVSVFVTPGILKIFSAYIPEGLHFNLVQQPDILLFLLALTAVVSLLAGFYPALVLTRFKPVTVLKNQNNSDSRQSRRAWVRKTLTVSQFVIAQFFIIATLVVGKQIRYALNMDLGFKKDAIVYFRAPVNFRNPDNKQFVLQKKIQSIPGIEMISLAGATPASPNLNVSTMKFNRDGKDVETTVEIKYADTAYLGLYHIKLLAGRNLQQSDTIRELLVNEAYAKFLGFKNPADIIGKSIDRGNGNGTPIIGVLADIHTKSLHQAIQPLVYTSQAKRHSVFHLALPQTANTDTWKETLKKVEKAFKEIYPEDAFDYAFFDESIARFYSKEQQASGLLSWSAGLAIFISSLGLLGLVIFTTNQRVKEIGIRKVLGASITQIVALLSKDFVRLVILAFIITVPVAWWAMHEWLNNFAYRTTISWWIFAVCGISMLVIALLIMAVRTVSAAMDNPVNSLRNE